MRWAAKNRERVRDNHRRWRDQHRPPVPPKPRCRHGHQVVLVPGRRWECLTCKEERHRQKGRDLWQEVKADPERLARKRAGDRAYARRKAERGRALRPPKPSRRQPDGAWRCIGCGQVKAETEFYRRRNGQVEARCKACCGVRRRELWAARRAASPAAWAAEAAAVMRAERPGAP
jgi:hypothetical protein